MSKSTADLVDLIAAAKARDVALESVAKQPWFDTAKAFAFSHIPSGRAMIGEEIRQLLLETGLPAPHHHNAWGALMRSLVHDKVMVATGAHRSMRTVKSHARKSPEYIRN